MLERISTLKYKDSQGPLVIADVGCATGAFPAFLMKQLPDSDITALELLPELVAEAKLRHPQLSIRTGSVLDSEVFDRESFDVITALGVLSIFDDVQDVLVNLRNCLKPGGAQLIHGMFNPYDIDVFVKYRDNSKHARGHLEPGWNIVSQKSCSQILTALGAKSVTFQEFKMEVDLPRKESDAVRSWTERLSIGERQIINGLWLKQPQFICEAIF